MKLTSLIDLLYATIYIAIVDQGSFKDVSVIIRSRGKNSEPLQQRFDSQKALERYILDLISDSPYFYIGLLNTVPDQGALPSCDKTKMRDLADVSLSVTLCMNERWSLYSSKGELDHLQQRHQAYGIDYVFSPFTVLQKFFTDKMHNVWALYVLIQEESVAIAVFSSEQLEFAKFVTTDAEEIALLQESANEGFSFDNHAEGAAAHEAIDMDEIDILDDFDALDDIESLDDIEELDDIDSIESFADFSEEEDDVPVVPVAAEPETAQDQEGFNLDYHRFTIIQNVLAEYYHNEHFRQDFIETIFIADAVGISSDLKLYIEEELFVTPIVRRIDLSREVMQLIQDEVNHAS